MSMRQLVLDMGLAPVPSLGNFVTVQNLDALEHLRLWVGDPQRPATPTFLWGSSGSGKTHLLQAVRQAFQEQGVAVGWIDTHVPAPPEFDDAWQVLLLDDCHLYSPTQQAMAFNWFVHAQAPRVGPARWVLATAACPPTDLRLREDLRTRLGWGHVFQLHTLAETENRAVLCRAADERGVALSPEVLDFMLNHFSRDLGSLMQLLEQLDGYALRTQRAITIPLIKAMLEND